MLDGGTDAVRIWMKERPINRTIFRWHEQDYIQDDFNNASVVPSHSDSWHERVQSPSPSSAPLGGRCNASLVVRPYCLWRICDSRGWGACRFLARCDRCKCESPGRDPFRIVVSYGVWKYCAMRQVVLRSIYVVGGRIEACWARQGRQFVSSNCCSLGACLPRGIRRSMWNG